MRRTKAIKRQSNEEESSFEPKNTRQDIPTSTSYEILRKLDELKADINVVHNNVLQNSAKINEIVNIKELFQNENRVVVDLVSEVKVIIKNNLCPSTQNSKYNSWFPIKTQSQLDEFETEASSENKNELMAAVKKLICRGLRKSLEDLFDIKLLMDYNVDGRQGKKRLLDYPNVLDMIYRSIPDNIASKSHFLDELRKCIRISKNVYYKVTSNKPQAPNTEVF